MTRKEKIAERCLKRLKKYFEEKINMPIPSKFALYSVLIKESPQHYGLETISNVLPGYDPNPDWLKAEQTDFRSVKFSVGGNRITVTFDKVTPAKYKSSPFKRIPPGS